MRLPEVVAFVSNKLVYEKSRSSAPSATAETLREREELFDKFRRGLYVPDILPAPVRERLLERVSRGELEGGPIRNLFAAERVVRRSHGAIRSPEAREFAQFPEGPRRREAYLRLARFLREAELPVTELWARSEGLLLNRRDFDQKWEAGGQRGESEHEVYYEPQTQRWFKRNLLTFHNCGLEYLHRIALHNFLFPETALRFEGFMKLTNDLLAPVVSQGHVRALRGATFSEVQTFLSRTGFRAEHRKDGSLAGFRLGTFGIWLEDLHEENAFITDPDEAVAAVDPIVFLDHNSKLRRLRDYFADL